MPKGSVVIQVFSSPERARPSDPRPARGRRPEGLSLAGEVGGRTMYRVRIGPFGSREDAQKVAEKVRKGYKLDTWVTE